jgi:hypothetical protein
MQSSQLVIVTITLLSVLSAGSTEWSVKHAFAQSIDQSGNQSIDQSGNQSIDRINESDFVCYMQTAEGNLLDLTSICGTRRPVANMQPASIINISPISNLGGLSSLQNPDGTPCFGLDAQGRPCASAR